MAWRGYLRLLLGLQMVHILRRRVVGGSIAMAQYAWGLAQPRQGQQRSVQVYGMTAGQQKYSTMELCVMMQENTVTNLLCRLYHA